MFQKKNSSTISILPLSYKTDEILISSFLEQISVFLKNCELVVILESDDKNGFKLWEKQIKLFNIKNFILEHLKKTSSKGECLNFGISKCKGDYIMRCDMDDYILPNRLKDTLSIIKNYSSDLIYSDMIDLKTNLIIRYPEPNLLSLYSTYKNPIPAPTVCFKRSFFYRKKLKFPRTNRCEDLYLTLSFIDKKAKFYKLDTPVVKYNNNNKFKRDFLNWIMNSKIRLMRGRYDTIGFISLLIGFIFFFLGILVFFISRFKE